MSKEDEVIFMSPPRLLLGVTLLFWGAMHGQALPALAAAILVEGRHWTNLRWCFGEKGFARSWQLSVLILIVAALGLMQVEEAETGDFLNLLSWLPFMMLPLALAQQYCSDRGVPMTTFSFIARRKMAADRKAGRVVRVSDVDLGYPYFFLILIGAGIGRGDVLKPGVDELYYALGVLLLLGWGLFRLGARRGRIRAWGLAYLASLMMAFLMMGGVLWLYERYIKSLTQPTEQAGSPFETMTSIGQVHKLQLSPSIRWRYYHEEGKVPDLVKISSYNWPEGDLWRARMRRNLHRERIPEERDVGGDFEKFLEVDRDVFLFHERDEAVVDFQTRGEIVGMVSDQSLIPHPLHTKRLAQLQVEILSANSMGAIQLNGPSQAAMKIRLFADEDLDTIEHDPSMMDLLCPSKEKEGLDHFLKELDLEAVTWAPNMKMGRRVEESRNFPPQDVSEGEALEASRVLEGYFDKNFSYSLFLTGADLRAPMSEFVNKKRVGHCEYFAGATTLLLRRMGIPSRYVVGFAVREEGADAGEYLIRGKHAHAWSQAYVGGTWVDESKPGAARPLWRCRGGRWVTVDLTPASWLSEGEKKAWYQGVFDWFQKAKANLVLWFARPAVTAGFKYLLLSLGFLFFIYLSFKMLRTRRREGEKVLGSWEDEVRKRGYLNDFERWLSRRVGQRPSWMPMGQWLDQHLPEEARGLIRRYEEVTFLVERGDVDGLKRELEGVKGLWKKGKKTP